MVEEVINAVGRKIPLTVNNRRLIPYKGQFAYPPPHRKATMAPGFIKPTESKMLSSIREAIIRCGLKDGMTISFHHHLRAGDYLVNMVLDEIAQMGIRNLKLAPSALFPNHAPLLDHIRSGVVTSIEGSCNGPVGDAASRGLIPEPVVLRSHGGRVRAIQMGDIHIDVAFIAAPCTDPYGNANGLHGKSRCGPLMYSDVDAQYADKVVVVTDNLVDYPAAPISISQVFVDHVVEVDEIGDNERIVSGTLNITDHPQRLMIAEHAAQLVEDAGFLKNGFSFQSGAGGMSLATTKFLGERMAAKGVVANFATGGTTKYLLDIFRQGRIKHLLTGQSFDLDSIDSLLNDINHHEVNADMYANPFNKGDLVNMTDVVFLGATEVDTEFNVNVVTHSDGRMLHGIGGHQDTAAGAKMTVILVPVTRKSIPIIKREVTTITTPGETVDAVVTDHGIAINPRRKDLLKAIDEHSSDLKLRTIEDLAQIAEDECGIIPKPATEDRVIGIVENRDGTVLDVIRQIKK